MYDYFLTRLCDLQRRDFMMTSLFMTGLTSTMTLSRCAKKKVVTVSELSKTSASCKHVCGLLSRLLTKVSS